MDKGIIIRGLEAPETCSECFLRTTPELIAIQPNMYKYISCCSRSPEDVEDPWRDITWQANNKESFCPISDL